MNAGSRRPAGPGSGDAACGVASTSKTCSRARSLVESGLLDVAAGISSLASSLTHAAIKSIENRMSERGHRASADHVEFLRTAIFHGIAQNIIERFEQRLRAEPQTRDVLSIPPDLNKWAKVDEAQKSHAAWPRRKGR
jgi:hypothetical protein